MKTNHELLETIYPLINRYVGYDEDLFQEGCILVLEKIKDYDPERGKLTTWAYQILKGVWRKRLTPYFKVGSTVRFKMGKANIPDNQIPDTYNRPEINLNVLDPFEKYLVVHHFYEGVTKKELARLSDCSPPHIGNVINRALEKLRHAIQVSV